MKSEKIKYREKLKDPRWQKKRLKILNRDGFKCMSCLDDKSMLVAHHLYYLQNHEPWEYPNMALITICQPCHSVVKQIDFRNLWKRRLKLRLMRNQEKIPNLVISILFIVFRLKHI
jgi:5-methylcytosine-specific restriction endonuclease McrA